MKIECSEGSSHIWSFRLKDDRGHVIMEGVKTYDSQAKVERGVEGLATKLGVEVVCVPLEVPAPESEGG